MKRCVHCKRPLEDGWPFAYCGLCPLPTEHRLAAEFGMEMAVKYRADKGKEVPDNCIEFAGMLAIAFMLGRESIAGVK